jgi:predicted dehydrogenase
MQARTCIKPPSAMQTPAPSPTNSNRLNEISRRRFFQATAAGGALPLLASLEAAAPDKNPPLAPPDKQPENLKVPAPVSRKAGWAIVGLGELSLGEVMPAFRESKFSQPVALVSGHPDKASRVAETYNIPGKAIYDYANFDSIAGNESIDAVYIVLPNSMHAEYTIRALKAGKHVLCEKPMAATVAECEAMIAAAKEAKRKLMIGYRLHYEPFNQRVMELCESKVLGGIRTISSSNCQQVQAPNIRLSSKLAGGPVGDIGIYSINAARYITRENPIEVTAAAHQTAGDPRFREVPESVMFTMRFPSGILAHCDCSFGAAESRFYRIHCEKGYIELDPAFSYRGLRLHVKEGDAKTGNVRNAEVPLEPVNHFAAEMDHFSKCILNDDAPRTPGEEGLADMRVIAAIEEALSSGRTVSVKS